MEERLISNTAFRLISLAVTCGLIYLYFWRQARKKRKTTVKTNGKTASNEKEVSGAGKMFWVVFYFIVGVAVVVGGLYIWLKSANHSVGYGIGGVVLGLVLFYEGYTVIKPRKK